LEGGSMEFSALAERAIRIRHLYAQLEQHKYGRSWSGEEVMLGFIGDVGDLAKLILAKEGVRDIADANDKLAHELADCLWSVLVLAALYDVDLEHAFVETMDEIEKYVHTAQ
jgi:NTP pyrophosphatase (non-canonical NTP hydrolase)